MWVKSIYLSMGLQFFLKAFKLVLYYTFQTVKYMSGRSYPVKLSQAGWWVHCPEISGPSEYRNKPTSVCSLVTIHKPNMTQQLYSCVSTYLIYKARLHFAVCATCVQFWIVQVVNWLPWVRVILVAVNLVPTISLVPDINWFYTFGIETHPLYYVSG